MREQAKLEKEIEEQRKKIIKEQTHYNNQLKTIDKQLSEQNLSESDIQSLEAKKSEVKAQLCELEKSLKDVDYRAANQKAGYVYVISNIGSFDENIYKIGMTRRLDPMERVSELGDASVPFKFDVHAMIFSDNAPALEAALHKAFEDKKLNMVNTRREFFNVTLDEIEAVVKANYDKTVEFNRLAPAEQYRESLKIKSAAIR
ncbi:MAG: GIY-YIG nuclease family protein [Clostridiales bacterium]|nr:GIY-YIG nuclease family protein [Clostridiales bacterium]